MPVQAAITVKKYDNVTDIIYDVLQPSGGDGTWAKWRQDTGNAQPNNCRPQLWIRTLESANGIRRVEVRYDYPHYYTDTTTSQVVNSGKSVAFRNGTLTVPQGIPASFVNEAVAQLFNLLNHTLVRSGHLTQTSFF